jgi:Ca2+-binding RTX toxin-like protein
MYIPGTSDNEQLTGTNGNDHFDGGAGDDVFIGGLGDDYYIVNSDGDQVIELANQGVDTVVATVDYTLASNVENLYLAGDATFGAGNNSINFLVANATLGSELYGFGGDDVLIGGAGDDTLNGGAGNDYLNGGAGNNILNGGLGNDYYVVNSTQDQVVETPNAGIDTIVASVDYSLTNNGVSNNVENLFLTGNATFGYGNSSDNYMVANQSLGSQLYGDNGNDVIMGSASNDYLDGGAGNDYLNGGAGNDYLFGNEGNDYIIGGDGSDNLVGSWGNDILTGGAGSDRFVLENYYWNSFGEMGVDVITDFSSGQDKIQLYGFDGVTFGSFSFASVTSDQQAATSDATIVYNSTSGSLSYNQDRATDGFGAGGQFATLSPNLTLTANDFNNYSDFNNFRYDAA